MGQMYQSCLQLSQLGKDVENSLTPLQVLPLKVAQYKSNVRELSETYLI